MNKYEQLIEYIINDESDKARNLFHTIVVEKSRDIYESLTDDDSIGGNQVKGLADEVALDEQGLSEEEEDGEGFETEINSGEFGDDAEESDFDADDEFGGDEFGAEGDDASVEGRVNDLESALDELSAKFDELMGAEESEGHEFGDDAEESDFDADDEFGGDEFGAEEEFGGDEIVREYVEKVGTVNRTGEGQEVGKGKSLPVNKSSVSAGKNDFGGTAKNLNQGKPNGSAPNAPQKASNYATKGQGTVPVASRNINVPGGKAGSAFKTKQSADRTGEGQTTDGKETVTKNSLLKARK